VQAACKSDSEVTPRPQWDMWRVNASLHRGNILYGQQNDLGTISMIIQCAIVFHSFIALSMDINCTNLLTTSDSLANWTHCAFFKSMAAIVKYLEQECTGWGWKRRRRADNLFASFFYLYFIRAPWYTIYHGWEALWYVTDMNIILPLFSLCSRRRHFAAATRNAIRIPLS